MNDTNVSTSCAEKVTVQDGCEKNKDNSSFDENFSKASNFKPHKVVKQSVKCACTCGNFVGQGPSFERTPFKRQTCFNCGITGHIARNCPNRAYITNYAQGRHNVSRGRSFKRNSSRSCDDDLNTSKTKN